MENGGNKLIWPKYWVEVCALFFKDGVQEMTRNASSYVI